MPRFASASKGSERSEAVGVFPSVLEFRPISPDLEESLAGFFVEFAGTGDTRQFHPHEFSAEEARCRAQYDGKDLYYVALCNGQVLAYGMLRGWDEGYKVPSLGIALHPVARGTGLARAFMHFLHAAAKARGASSVRLKVYPENVKAVRLYKSLGYTFEKQEAGQLVGLLVLGEITCPTQS